MPNLYCPHCLISYEPRARFCSKCGTPLEAPQFLPPIQSAPEPKSSSNTVLTTLAWLAASAVILCLLGLVCVITFSYSVSALRNPIDPLTNTNEPFYTRPTLTPNPQDAGNPPPINPELAGIDPTSDMNQGSFDTGTPVATQRPAGRPFVGELAPEFTLVDASSSEPVTLSHFTGQPVIVHFWATWCGYCEEEFLYLQQAFEIHRETGLAILAVDYEDRRDDVIEYGRAHDLTFPLLLDKDGEITDNAYQVNGFPTTFFVYPDGTISFIQIGTMTREEFNQQLKKIMPP